MKVAVLDDYQKAMTEAGFVPKDAPKAKAKHPLTRAGKSKEGKAGEGTRTLNS